MLDLYGYTYSVYAWIARLVLHEKGVGYRWVEVNPFADDMDPDYLATHPFRRVPALADGDFVLYETGAITRYIDEKFPGPRLQPAAPCARARLNQILSVIDGYAYRPLVRQVFSHGVMRPRFAWPADPDQVARGLAASTRVLDALDRLADGGEFLVGPDLSLVDLHLAPMLSYFCEAEAGRRALDAHAALRRWFESVVQRPAFRDTRPALPAATAARV